MTPTAKIRQHIAEGRTMHVVGANDALSARLIEQAGFDAVLRGQLLDQCNVLGQTRS